MHKNGRIPIKSQTNLLVHVKTCKAPTDDNVDVRTETKVIFIRLRLLLFVKGSESHVCPDNLA